MFFYINNIKWKIKFVSINNSVLTRSDGSRTVGMTDWNTCTVYLANNLTGKFLERVLCHELCHCICFSYNIKMDIDQDMLIGHVVHNLIVVFSVTIFHRLSYNIRFQSICHHFLILSDLNVRLTIFGHPDFMFMLI